MIERAGNEKKKTKEKREEKEKRSKRQAHTLGEKQHCARRGTGG